MSEIRPCIFFFFLKFFVVIQWQIQNFSNGVRRGRWPIIFPLLREGKQIRLSVDGGSQGGPTT